MPAKVVVTVEDVGGSFRRFMREAPKEARAGLQEAIDKTAFSLAQRMRAKAPVGPDAPHIRDAVSMKSRRNLSAEVGYINATESAGPGNPATIAEVALYNEFKPNHQPFMRPSAEAEANDYRKRAEAAIRQLERALAVPEFVSTSGATSSSFIGRARGGRGTG